jgi:hypothetical protein
MNFKIVAIRPLGGCNEDLIKVLKPETTYFFYSGFTIDRTSIQYSPTLSDGFFRTGKPDISVSAIAGKNGSGKSSLVELLIACINNLAQHFEFKSDAEIESVPNVMAELYFQADSYYKIVFRGNKIQILRQGKSANHFTKINSPEFSFRDFFYSIIINYSIFGLNAKEVGRWINGLFHKNDGYQIPIVLNPMRTDGNIDINAEMSLAEGRLMANLLRPGIIDNNDQLLVTENAVADKIRLQLIQENNWVIYENRYIQKSSTERKSSASSSESTTTEEVRIEDLKDNPNELLKGLNAVFNFGFKGKWETGDLVQDLAYRYLIRKLVKIAVTYPFYHPFFDKEGKKFKEGKFREFLLALLNKNENHISFKLKQTLNFLKYRHIEVRDHLAFYLDIQPFAQIINAILKRHKLKTEDIIYLLPPPIFKHNIILRSITNHSKSITFDKLSSGEKQLILSVNSVLYHLINLNSIRNGKFQLAYRFVNIFMDEIELYFHPDLQKQFVHFLLNRIGELKYETIKSINLCFITHSPFILSDIPNSNTLFLDEYGYPKKDAIRYKTFGANIHDLLKNNFFLTNGSIGEFAKDKINDAINFINHQKLVNEIKSGRFEDRELLVTKKKEEADLREKVKEPNKIKHKETIDLIGEPIIQAKLAEMYDEVTEEDLQISIVRKRIEELKLEEKQLLKKTKHV